MIDNKKIKSALISVFYKDKLDLIVHKLHEHGVKIYSTGGTQSFIEGLGVPVTPVENLTAYPAILGGRVKTLHPKIFGGILARRSYSNDIKELNKYEIPEIDLVIVDLYPFEETLASSDEEQQIIEKIDIGGISLIRAAAKNYKDVLIVSSRNQYSLLSQLLEEKQGSTSLLDRKKFAMMAFSVSSHYDTAIFNYFNRDFNEEVFKASILNGKALRYGENPHQKGWFYGKFEDMFTQLHGKEISYNNLLDIDAAVQLIAEFKDITVAILKHNNACGIASRDNLKQAWVDALAGDPISAFGGIIVTNQAVDKESAEEMNKLFFEIIIAPSYEQDALEVLKQKKNRIILIQKQVALENRQFKSLLNGVVVQEKDLKVEVPEDLKPVTEKTLERAEIQDLLFANKIVKHSKSNAIVLVKNMQLLASGVGQTSRVDALKQAIAKAKSFGFDLNGAVMASDAFFPFADSVEIANKEGITAVIQPGGSVKDQDSIDYCNKNQMKMAFTGTRHFRH